MVLSRKPEKDWWPTPPEPKKGYSFRCNNCGTSAMLDDPNDLPPNWSLLDGKMYCANCPAPIEEDTEHEDLLGKPIPFKGTVTIPSPTGPLTGLITGSTPTPPTAQEILDATLPEVRNRFPMATTINGGEDILEAIAFMIEEALKL